MLETRDRVLAFSPLSPPQGNHREPDLERINEGVQFLSIGRIKVGRGMEVIKDSHMEMRLALRLGRLDALFENVLCLFDILAVQINRVWGYAPGSVVFAENKLGRLPIVLLH
jgi:hypothetical protein